MGTWKISSLHKIPKLTNPVLIEGLPGIGNVGKIAVDFIIQELNGVKAINYFSYSFPHSVFITEENLVELPVINIYYIKWKKNDILLLAGDIQPIDETSSYEFTDKILDLAQTHGVKEIITLGGIGLQSVPKNPKVYCTANSKDIIATYKKLSELVTDLYGKVGPIVGVSGILLGLAKERNIQGISLLSETYGHPMYLGIKGAQEILKILNKRFDFAIDVEKLDKDIEEIETEMIRKADQLVKMTQQTSDRKKRGVRDVDYIG